MEAALEALGFESLDILQPSLLLSWRREMRPLELLAARLHAAAEPAAARQLRAYRAISARTVGRRCWAPRALGGAACSATPTRASGARAPRAPARAPQSQPRRTRSRGSEAARRRDLPIALLAPRGAAPSPACAARAAGPAPRRAPAGNDHGARSPLAHRWSARRTSSAARTRGLRLQRTCAVRARARRARIPRTAAAQQRAARRCRSRSCAGRSGFFSHPRARHRSRRHLCRRRPLHPRAACRTRGGVRGSAQGLLRTASGQRRAFLVNGAAHA